MSASSDYLQTLTRLTEAKGQAQAEAARANGQVWGSALSNIGQYISQIPQQQAQLKEIQNRAALTDLEKQREQRLAATEQRQQQAQQAATQALSQLKKTPDGLWDVSDAMQRLGSTGLDPTHVESFTTGLQKLNDMTLAERKRQDEANADRAHSFLSIYKGDEPITPESMSFNAEALKGIGGITDADAQSIHDITANVPPGTDLRPLLKAIEQKSEKYKPKYATAPEGSSIYDQTTGQPIGTPTPKKPKTKAELAQDAADPNSPTAAMSKAALDLLNTAPGTSNGELKPVRVNGKMVFAVFDPKTKRLTYQGQDVTESAEPPRDPLEAQAASIAAQAAAQARSQGFTEKQAGRKELTEKVEQPYQTAQSGVDTLRETIQAAKDGNVVAGQLQSLLTTMATLKAEGFNRINTAEINATGDAGSMFQRIEGWFGKAKEGQPIPASVQQDMQAYADILEKAAYKKYQSGFQTTTKRYGLTDEKPLPAPISTATASPKEGETKPIPGYPGTEQTFKNGKWIRTK